MTYGENPTPEAQAFPRPFGSKYVLLRHLATGGMADVFLARQTGSAGFVKECVIKRILPHLARDSQFVTMFLDEARLCARLNHPNIAQVYDLGQVGDDYFIAMEHVHGVDLERVIEVIRERGETHMPAQIAARIIASAADALEHAHNAVDALGRPLGIVHRDVTPSNIMVSFEGVPKLLDFGIAKASHKQFKTEVGVVRGKAPYMSPEQVEGDALDARSDLFSLGAVLYELTTGKKPFDGETSHKIGMRILHDDPTPPTMIIDDYPELLEKVVMGALAKRPTERIQSARQLQTEIERFLITLGIPSTGRDVADYMTVRFPRERVQIAIVGREGGTPPTPGGRAGGRPSAQLEVALGDTMVGAEPPQVAAKLPTPHPDTMVDVDLNGATVAEAKAPQIPPKPSAVPTTKVPALARPSALPSPTESIGEAIARIRAATNPRAAQASQSAARPVAPPPGRDRPATQQQVIIGDTNVDEEQVYEQRSNLGGGGGSRMMVVVIVGLVLAVGAGLLVLRNYQLKKEQDQTQAVAAPVEPTAAVAPAIAPAAIAPPASPPTAAPAIPGVTADPAPAAAPPPTSPDAPPNVVAPVAAAPDAPPPAGDEPSVTQLPTIKKKEHHHSSHSTPLNQLPRLPKLPPGAN